MVSVVVGWFLIVSSQVNFSEINSAHRNQIGRVMHDINVGEYTEESSQNSGPLFLQVATPTE